MAWSYSKTITTNDRIWWGAGNGRLHWTRTWTVTELTPTQAGYIRLQMALSSSEYVAYADADGSVVTYNTTVTDTVSCGGQTVTIRGPYTVGDTYTGYYSVEFQVPASWAGQTVTFTVTNNSQSVTFGATPAQPSTVSASDGYLGQEIPITLNRAISDVTHTVTVSCLGRTETLLTNSAAASTTWTPALATYGPLLGSSASSATATISCETFYQGTSVGTDSATITVSLAASDGAPAGASGWATASPYNSGAASGMSGWIQGFSRAQVSFNASKITTRYGATIAGYSITALGETDSTSPYRTPVLQAETQIQCKVTDSRGFAYTETLTVTPQSYAAPALSSIRAIRCDSLGAEDEDGTYCLAQATLTYSSLGGENQCGMWVSYKTRQASSYGAETALQSGTALLLSGLDPDQTYDVRIRAQDTLGGQVEALRTLMPRSWAMKFRPNGQGVGFGKAPTQQNELELGNGWVLKLNDANGNSVTLSYAQLQQLLNLI